MVFHMKASRTLIKSLSFGVEIVKRGHSTLFRKIGKHIMDESMRLENSRTMHQIIKDVLKGSVKDISRTDLNDLIKTAVWKPDKDNKSVQRFMSRMRDRHTREEADAKRLIKKGLTPEPYLYEIPEPGERFEFIVVENDLSQKVGDKMEYPEVVRDRKSTRLNSSHSQISYAVFCLKKKKKKK